MFFQAKNNKNTKSAIYIYKILTPARLIIYFFVFSQDYA